MEGKCVVDFTPRPGPYIKDQLKKKNIIKPSKIKKYPKVYIQYNFNNTENIMH